MVPTGELFGEQRGCGGVQWVPVEVDVLEAHFAGERAGFVDLRLGWCHAAASGFSGAHGRHLASRCEARKAACRTVAVPQVGLLTYPPSDPHSLADTFHRLARSERSSH